MTTATVEGVGVTTTTDTAGRLARLAVAWTRRYGEAWTSEDVAACLLSQVVADHTRDPDGA